MLIGILVSIIAFLLTDGKSFDNMLFYRWDYFMDYFNSTYHSTRNPYSLPFKSIYPALTTAGYFLISFVLEELHGPFLTSLDVRSSFAGVTSYLLLTVVALLILYKIFGKKKEISFKETLFFYVFILASFPMVWAIDRGNSVLISVIFSLLFIAGHDSESKKIRCASYICLGIATGIKIFPAFFGVLVLRNYVQSKRIEDLKEIILCVFIVVVVFLTPFILFEGSFFAMINNAFGYRGELSPIGGVDVSSLIQTTAYLFGYENYLSLSGEGTAISLVLMFVIVLCLLLNKKIEKWEQIFLIAGIQALCAGIGHPYVLLYMLIPAWYFINSNPKNNTKNLILAILFALILMLFPGPSTGYELLSYTKGMALLTSVILILVINTTNLFDHNTNDEKTKSK